MFKAIYIPIICLFRIKLRFKQVPRLVTKQEGGALLLLQIKHLLLIHPYKIKCHFVITFLLAYEKKVPFVVFYWEKGVVCVQAYACLCFDAHNFYYLS